VRQLTILIVGVELCYKTELLDIIAL